MKNKISMFFSGRCGMDELNRMLAVTGLLSVLFSSLTGNVISFLFRWLALVCMFWFAVRLFSKDLYKRQAENSAYLRLLQKKKDEFSSAKERRKQRKEFVFFRCPSCKKYLRVPRGKGKIHINCKCGYILYRKT